MDTFFFKCSFIHSFISTKWLISLSEFDPFCSIADVRRGLNQKSAWLPEVSGEHVQYAFIWVISLQREVAFFGFMCDWTTFNALSRSYYIQKNNKEEPFMSCLGAASCLHPHFSHLFPFSPLFFPFSSPFAVAVVVGCPLTSPPQRAFSLIRFPLICHIKGSHYELWHQLHPEPTCSYHHI